jgi:type II secretory pathway pseudopilin PulG
MTSRAFSMIELLVGLTIGVIVLGVAVGLTAGALRAGERTRVRTDLARDAEFAARVLAMELRQAGAGVPHGEHAQQNCSGASCAFLYGNARPAKFDANLVLATSSAIGFVGDVARPDAQYPALGFLARRPTGSADTIMWHTENNGGCAPTVPPSCSPATTSVFFPGMGGCDSPGAGTERTCPWGMRRVLPGERLQIVAGNQNWSQSAMGPGPTLVNVPLPASAPPGVVRTLGVQLSEPFDNSAPLVWPNTGGETPPMGQRGTGWVTTLDRVFFLLDGDRLKRVQCTGDVDPTDPAWLAPATFTPSADFTAAPNTCGPPETIARRVRRFELTYASRGAPLVAPLAGALRGAVDQVNFVLELATTTDGREVTHATQGSIPVRPFEI